MLLLSATPLLLLLSNVYVEAAFAPRVEATCKAGFMIIQVNFNMTKFKGVVHGNGYRASPGCTAVGDGSPRVTLTLPLITDREDAEYCGVRLNETSKEKMLPLIIRAHHFLETKEDKFYTIKCGPQGFRNNRNESSFVDLQLHDMEGKKTNEAVFNRQYKLRAQIDGHDNDHTMRVGNCFSFGDVNRSIALTDHNGCPSKHISSFTYNDTSGVAETTLTMFRFADTNRVNFQCEMIICKKPCAIETCTDTIRTERLIATEPAAENINKKMVKAATTVFVVDPALTSGGYPDCEWHPTWLWILTIAFGALFFIMLIINLFLCASMTCMCSSTDIVEREPSVIEEYDPYRSSWHGSQCGSRYSLGGGMKNGGYLSGASTLNSGRSVSSHSDHYAAIMHHRQHGPQHHHSDHPPHHHSDHPHASSANHRRQLSSSSSHNNHRSPSSTVDSHYAHRNMM